jgi:HAD superfamily hydrolase (TIGR01509 family)
VNVVQAVIFDMDGLLIDSEPVWDDVRRAMADEAGTPWTKDDHLAVMGVSTAEWADHMLERLQLQMSREEVIEHVVGRMAESYAKGIPWLPGALDAIDLAVANYRVALASGSHRALIDVVTADAAVAGKFEIIVAADEVGVGKPAPDVYLATAERLGVDPTKCVCLEDSSNGILSGVAAGMKVIAVPDPRFPSKPEVIAQADLVLSSLTELSTETFERI